MSHPASRALQQSTLTRELARIVERLYPASGAARYGIPPETFVAHVAAVLERYGANFSAHEKDELLGSLHIAELVLARACAAGNNLAWDDFISRFRPGLYQAARQIVRDDAAGRDLADSLYAELYGLPNREGRRVSRLDYYMGRGSLAGWLRTVAAQRHIDACRSRTKDVSLDEQMEAGVSFPACEPEPAAPSHPRLPEAVTAVLGEIPSADRFLLASYYLDGRTLAALGRDLRVHESTVSRRLDKLTALLRARIRKRLMADGFDARRCAELMAGLDVRDLNVDVQGKLRQDSRVPPFKVSEGEKEAETSEPS
jgi:RNA polymerase sigma-70 factor (ECF subfamily)